MEIKTSAIVLQTIKYGDSQLIVDFFTEKLGRLSFMVRVPKSSKEDETAAFPTAHGLEFRI